MAFDKQEDLDPITTWCDVVPYVISRVWCEDDFQESAQALVYLLMPYVTVEAIEEDPDSVELTTEIGGWRLCGDYGDYKGPANPGHFGKHKTLFSESTWVRDGKYVYAINESDVPYEDGIEMSFVADSREALESFWNDVLAQFFEDPYLPEIGETEAVQQTA